MLLLIPQRYEFSSKSQPSAEFDALGYGCCWYHKGTNFQANHNANFATPNSNVVVADTTKVRIFKQITTIRPLWLPHWQLLLIPQRYEFSSKSQLFPCSNFFCSVVADTTKVRIFKQITTKQLVINTSRTLLLIPQRYEFSSKSQLLLWRGEPLSCCCWYHKGTNFQANHNVYHPKQQHN